MNHKKGILILSIIAVVSLVFGIHSIASESKKSSFSFNYSNSEDSENEDFFDDEFDEDFSDESLSENPIGKIISSRFRKNSGQFTKIGKNSYVSVIYISGVISEANRTYNQKWLLKKIKSAKNDSKNCGILLKIDSPGGTVYESDEAYLALIDYKKTTDRPVYAYFGSLAASGGYYIGCSADTIYANRNCLTGSIGVIAGQSLDATELLNKIGVKMTTITAGRNKNMGNYNSVLTDEQRSILQSIADEAYEQFTGIVAESRNLPLSKIKELADGRIYTANQAKNNGLIDGVCSYESAKDLISEDFEKEVDFIEYKYHYEENWMSILSGASSFITNPESSIYDFLGNTSAKCLYLYHF